MKKESPFRNYNFSGSMLNFRGVIRCIIWIPWILLCQDLLDKCSFPKLVEWMFQESLASLNILCLVGWGMLRFLWHYPHIFKVGPYGRYKWSYKPYKWPTINGFPWGCDPTYIYSYRGLKLHNLFLVGVHTSYNKPKTVEHPTGR